MFHDIVASPRPSRHGLRRRYRFMPGLVAVALAFIALPPVEPFGAANAQAAPAVPARPLFTIDVPGRASGSFTEIASLDVAPDGSVYLADRARHRILRYSGSGELLGAWGGLSRADGRFLTVPRLAIAPDGSVLVPDSLGRGAGGGCAWRHQRFSAEGLYLGTMALRDPVQAIGPDGSLYAVDCYSRATNPMIVRRAPDGSVLSVWGEEGDGEGQFRNVSDVAVGPDGTVFVAEYFADRVQAFSKDGRFLYALGADSAEPRPFRLGWSVAAGDGRTYVEGGKHVHRFDDHGHFLGSFRAGGEGDTGGVTAMAVALDGSLYVLGSGAGAVERFDAEGALLQRWATSPPENQPNSSTLSDVTSLMAGPENEIRVLQAEGHAIQRFDALGGWIGAMELEETALDGAVTPDGATWLLLESGEVVRVTAAGTVDARWRAAPPDDMDRGGEIALGKDGSIYFTHHRGGWIQRHAPDGRILSEFGDPPNPTDPDESWLFVHIAVAPDGTVLTVEDEPPGSDLAAGETFGKGQRSVEQIPQSFRVRHYEPNGTLRTQWLLQDILPVGTYIGHTGRPAVDEKGTVVVPILNSMVAFSLDGTFLRRIGRYGFDAYAPLRPRKPIFDSLGRLVVLTDGWANNARIHVFAPTTALDWRVSTFDNPHLLGWPVDVAEMASADFAHPEGAPSPWHGENGFSRHAHLATDFDAGGFELRVQATGGVRLWVDDRLVLDRGQADSVDEAIPVVLPRGRHDLVVESVHRGPAARLAVDWTRTGDVHTVFVPFLRR